MYRKNRMKICCLTAALSLSVALSACSGRDVSADADNSPQGSFSEIQNSDLQGADGKEKPEEAPTVSPAASPAVSGMETASEALSLQELPAYVFCAADGRLLLLGDTITLVDSHTMEIEKRNENPEGEYSFRELLFCKMTESEEEYLVLGQYLQMKEVAEGLFAGDGEGRLIMVRIGKDLKVRETVDMGKRIDARRIPDNYELIDNGTKLLYSSLEGLFLYDMQTNEKIDYLSRPTASGQAAKKTESVSISSFGYQKQTGQIIFSGGYSDGSHSDFLRTVGSVRSDGTQLRYEKEQTQEWGTVWCFDDFALIEDWKLYNPGEKGNVFYLSSDGKAAVYPLADEYTAIRPSEKGNYFAVRSKEWDADGNHAGYTVRIYASDGGTLLQEIRCPLSEIGQGTALYENIICEDTGKVLLLTCDRETEENVSLKAVALKK